jgi:outer membrane protein
MKSPAALLLVALLSCTLLPSARAAPAGPWSVRAGYAYAAFAPSSSLSLAGSVVPGASVAIDGKSLVLGDVGYAFDDRWTVRFAFAAPPTVTVAADGALTGYMPPLGGTLGTIKLAPAVLSATYSPGEFAALRPYLGAGVNYTKIVKSTDGDIASLQARDAWGSALEIGCDLLLDRSWSAFVDVRKVYVRTTATGTVPVLGGAPVQATVALDPLLVSVGIGYRF